MSSLPTVQDIINPSLLLSFAFNLYEASCEKDLDIDKTCFSYL